MIVKKNQIYEKHPLVAQGILQVDLNYRPIFIILVYNNLPIKIRNEMAHQSPLDLQTVGTPK